MAIDSRPVHFSLPLLFLLVSISFSHPCTPSSNCLCAPGPSLVCSCSSSSRFGALRLTANVLPDQLRQLVVHFCARVLVAEGTFSGKTIREQIKFVDIGELHIESGAFRDIRHSPHLLLVDNAVVPSLAAHSFAGLAHLQHFWWRNVTIGRLRAWAFAKVAFVDYLYFRNAHIKLIEPNAFDRMHQLGHLFLRDRIRVDRMAANAFGDTRLDELVVENALVRADHRSLVGLRAKRVRLENCWWGEREKEEREEVSPQTGDLAADRGELGEIVIRNCTIRRLPLIGKVRQLHVEHSQIGRLAGEPQKTGEQQQEQKSVAHNAHPHAHRQHLPVPAKTDTNRHHPRSQPMGDQPILPYSQSVITGTPSSSLRISHSRIRSLSMSAILPVSSAISSVLIRNSSVHRWLNSPFGHLSLIRQLRIEHSKLCFPSGESLPMGPFARVNASALQLVSCRLKGQLGQRPFEGSNVDEWAMVGCRLERAPGQTLFDGMELGGRAVVSECEWPCEGDRLLLSPTAHPNLHWQFSGNRCSRALSPTPTARNNSSSPRHSPFLHSADSHCESPSPPGLLCRRLGPLEECLCQQRPLPQSPLPVPVPVSSAKILLLGDCPDSSLLLQAPLPPLVHSLYVYRVGRLIVSSVPHSLRHLHVFHSALQVHGTRPFAGARLSELAVERGHLAGRAHPNAFSGARLERLRLDGTTVDEGWMEALRRTGTNLDGIVVERSRQREDEMGIARRCALGGCAAGEREENSAPRDPWLSLALLPIAMFAPFCCCATLLLRFPFAAY